MKFQVLSLVEPTGWVQLRAQSAGGESTGGQASFQGPGAAGVMDGRDLQGDVQEARSYWAAF